MKYARLAFPAAAALLLAACGGQAQTSGYGAIPSGSGPDSAISRPANSAQPFAVSQTLFVASALPYVVNAYALPLTSGSTPEVSLQTVNEPVPLAAEQSHLFVGSFDDGAVYRFSLPLSAGGTPEKLTLNGLPHAQSNPILNVGTPSGLAVGQGYLYVAGTGSDGKSEVLAYASPVRSGESPAATIGYGRFDFISLATANDTLYVGSAAQGTIRAFGQPLSSGESPQFTIHIPKQQNAVIGVAAWTSLYVTNYSTGEVLVYKLPYHSGESPVHLDLKIANGGMNPFPYGVAVDRSYLYVTAQGTVYQYLLPITAGEQPITTLPFDGSPSGVAVWPKWTQ